MTVPRLSRALIPLSLFADLLLFFRKPLFSEQYMFPWDFPAVQLPLIRFLADQLKNGELALWDPYTYCGNPIFANIQACLFHPLIFISAWLSNLVGASHLGLLVEWAVVIQLGIAGMGAYLLMRVLGVSRAAAWTTAVMCQTGPYFASRAEHIGAMMTISWMPVAWLAVCCLAKKMTARRLALLGVALGFAVLGGSPAATLAVFVSTLLLAILFAAAKLADFRLVAWTAMGCGIGIGLSAVQFIPSVQLTNHSVAKYRLEWLGTGGGLKLQSLVSLVAPNYYHIFDLKSFDGPWDPSFLYLYCSMLGLILAVAAIIRMRTPLVHVFTAMGLFGAFWMLGDSTPLFRLIYPLLPDWIRIGIHPEYTYCIFANCVAVLAGLGMSRFVSRAGLQWTIAVVIAADLYLVGSDRPMNSGPGGDAAGISANAVDRQPELLSTVRRITALDRPPARIDTIGTSVNWAQSAPMTRVATANGCSPLALERIMQVRLGLGDKNGRKSGWYYPVVNPGSPVINLMADRYLLAGSAYTGLAASNPNLKAAAEVAGVTLFENKASLPRAFLVRSTLDTDFQGAIGFVRNATSDFSNIAAVEGGPRLAAKGKSGSAGVAAITRYSASSMTVSVDAPSAAYLVVLEAWYPGWVATVDGTATPIYATDVAFRGIAIPAGRHTVELKFQPGILKVSALISLAFVGLTVALWISGASIHSTY